MVCFCAFGQFYLAIYHVQKNDRHFRRLHSIGIKCWFSANTLQMIYWKRDIESNMRMFGSSAHTHAHLHDEYLSRVCLCVCLQIIRDGCQFIEEMKINRMNIGFTRGKFIIKWNFLRSSSHPSSVTLSLNWSFPFFHSFSYTLWHLSNYYCVEHFQNTVYKKMPLISALRTHIVRELCKPTTASATMAATRIILQLAYTQLIDINCKLCTISFGRYE